MAGPRMKGTGEDWRISRVESDVDLAATGDLFRDYHAWLGEIVCSRRLTEEIADLPGPYAAPAGALLLARDDRGRAVGCVGIRPDHEGACEIKRLYVTPEARGGGAGRALAESAIGLARELGYACALMTSVVGRMEQALALYERLGFTRTESFYDHSHVHDDVELIFLELTL